MSNFSVTYKTYQITRMNSYTERCIISDKRGEFVKIADNMDEAKKLIDSLHWVSFL